MPNRHNRRQMLGAVSALIASRILAGEPSQQRIELICAPTSLGLRPSETGAEQGTWRAPAALVDAGLGAALNAVKMTELDHPAYHAGEQSGTRIRNGHSIRDFSVLLAHAVKTSIASGAFPLVVGGDCSVLLGALYGARLAGGRGLVHIDGHSDFFHPGNYDTRSRLGSAAGMDLALATGRGEELLTRWDGVDGPLVADEDAVQAGERDELEKHPPGGYADILRTKITRLTIQRIHNIGVSAAARQVIARLEARRLDRAWLHLDLDVLDQRVMPAVDSPGSPGFTFDELAEFVGTLVRSRRFVGAEADIYDPERDTEKRYAKPIVNALARAFAA